MKRPAPSETQRGGDRRNSFRFNQKSAVIERIYQLAKLAGLSEKELMGRINNYLKKK